MGLATSRRAPRVVSPLRDDILAKSPFLMFKLRVPTADGVFALTNDGHFEEFTELLSPTTDGLFSYKILQTYKVISYEAVSYNRFSLLIAIWSNGQWRLRFRVVPTTVHGVLIFKLSSKLQLQNGCIHMPDEKNTVVIIGIKPETDEVKIDFQIHANNDEPNSSASFIKSVKYNDAGGQLGSFTIDPELDGNEQQERKRFARLLYDKQ